MDSVVRLCRQYQQRLMLRDLTWPNAEVLNQERMQVAIYQCIVDMQTRSFHDFDYDKRFLKSLINRIKGPEPLDELFDLYSRLMRDYSKPSVSGISLDVPRDDYTVAVYTPAWIPLDSELIQPPTLSVLEKRQVLSQSGGTGHRTWEAALNLATRLEAEDISKHVSGRTVLELGAGTGLVAYACLLMNAKLVIATDGDHGSIRRLGQASVSVATPGTIHYQQLLWGDDAALNQLPVPLCGVDTVLAADVTYDPSIVPALVSTLKAIVDANAYVYILIVATARNLGTLEIFKSELDRHALRIKNPEGIRPPSLEDQRGFFHTADAPIHYLQIEHGRL